LISGYALAGKRTQDEEERLETNLFRLLLRFLELALLALRPLLQLRNVLPPKLLRLLLLRLQPEQLRPLRLVRSEMRADLVDLASRSRALNLAVGLKGGIERKCGNGVRYRSGYAPSSRRRKKRVWFGARISRWQRAPWWRSLGRIRCIGRTSSSSG
jgi:hypothetical protein